MRGNQYGVKHGMYRTPTYRSWRAMLSRCENPNATGYGRYGGRGITVCDRWRADFTAFLADMGERPSIDHSIDRIDTDGNYEPSNCRWATRSEQQQNKRRYTHGDQCKRGHVYAVDGVYLNRNGARQCKPCALQRAATRRTGLLLRA